LNFNSHHPIEHKLSVVRTLLELSQALISDKDDKLQEDKHVERALQACGYPDWTFKKVRDKMESAKKKKKKKKRQQEDSGTRSQVVIPYVKQVSETVARVLRKHHVSVAMRPVNTLKRLLVHPKDKQEKEETTECVYKIPCENCDRTYVGETGRKFGVRLKEHRSEVEAKSNKAFTRSQQAASLTERSKSALTDHAVQNNHVIDWSEATVVDREPDRVTRWIKEAVHIRKEGKKSMNRDEGCYTLSHVYDTVLATSLPYRDKNCRKKKNWNKNSSSDEGL